MKTQIEFSEMWKTDFWYSTSFNTAENQLNADEMEIKPILKVISSFFNEVFCMYFIGKFQFVFTNA